GKDPLLKRPRRSPSAEAGAPAATTDGASPRPGEATRTRPSRKGVVAVPVSGGAAATSPDQAQTVAPRRKLASPAD
ncbi:MAG: hypothetical protein ACRDV9_07755, partial [Acidimicrobiia bacterium]